MTSSGIAFVTGAAGGIGRAVALRLADDGFDVAINDLSTSKEDLDSVAEEIGRKGRKTLALSGDVSLDDEVRKMVERVVEVLGGLDIVSSMFLSYILPVKNTTLVTWP